MKRRLKLHQRQWWLGYFQKLFVLWLSMGSGNGLWVLGVGLGQSRFDQALQPGSLHFGGGANQDLMPSQVLRRFQFALKADLSEEPATKGRPKGEAKAKAKGKAKSRAKSAASKKGRKAAADAPEESAEAAAVDPKLKASGGESKADESMEVAEAEEEGLDAKPKRNCKKKQETAGSVSEKGSKRRRRAPNNASEQKGQKKEPDAPEEVVVEGGEKPEEEVGKKPEEEVGKKSEEEVGKKSEEEVGKKPANMSEPKGSEGKKRKGHASEVQERTFARRVRPKTSFPEAKWVALRDAFASHIKPKVSKPSTHEDLLSPCLMLSAFLSLIVYNIILNLNAII